MTVGTDRRVAARNGPVAHLRKAYLWLHRGILVATPEAAATFRIVFGASVVTLLAMDPVDAELLRPFEVARAEGIFGGVVRWLAERPALVDQLDIILLATGGLFVAGVATRVSFAFFTAAALTWGCVFTLSTSAHKVSALLLTLVALLPARWGDAWSVDALIRWWRGRAPTPAPSAVYGYAFWTPAFVLGVAYAAAALSKLRWGPDWILNGTVKYHFVTDLGQAWVSWGPWLTQYHPVAVGIAGFAVIVEALLITAMFYPNYTYRAIMGCSAAVLLAGFALFQGIAWPAWWVLLLAFLPWHRIQRRPGAARETAGALTLAQAATILLVAAQQLLVTAGRVEARPLFSSYDMYSGTYATPEEYEAASNLVYQVIGLSNGERWDLAGCVVHEDIAAIARRAVAGDRDQLALLKAALGGCLRERADLTQVMLEGERRVFIWKELRFSRRRGLDVIGPIDAALLRH